MQEQLITIIDDDGTVTDYQDTALAHWEKQICPSCGACVLDAPNVGCTERNRHAVIAVGD